MAALTRRAAHPLETVAAAAVVARGGLPEGNLGTLLEVTDVDDGRHVTQASSGNAASPGEMCFWVDGRGHFAPAGSSGGCPLVPGVLIATGPLASTCKRCARGAGSRSHRRRAASAQSGHMAACYRTRERTDACRKLKASCEAIYAAGERDRPSAAEAPAGATGSEAGEDPAVEDEHAAIRRSAGALASAPGKG